MSSCKHSLLRTARLATLSATVLVALSTADPVAANPIVIGIGAETDDADSRAYSLFTDIGLTDDTWLSASVARTDTDRELFDISTQYADIGIDHHFKPFGVPLRGGYRGDDDLRHTAVDSVSLYRCRTELVDVEVPPPPSRTNKI